MNQAFFIWFHMDAEWFWNQGWFCNQKRLILKPTPMIPKPRLTLKPKRWFWNQGWFRNQGQLRPRQIQERYLQERYCPHPPHPTPSGDDGHVECSCTCAKRRKTTARTLLFGDDAMQSVAARILVAEWCRFWLLNRAEFGCGIVFFWLRNRRVLVAESTLFGCRIVSDFGCGIAEIRLRNRRNMVAESDFIHFIWAQGLMIGNDSNTAYILLIWRFQ